MVPITGSRMFSCLIGHFKLIAITNGFSLRRRPRVFLPGGIVFILCDVIKVNLSWQGWVTIPLIYNSICLSCAAGFQRSDPCPLLAFWQGQTTPESARGGDVFLATPSLRLSSFLYRHRHPSSSQRCCRLFRLVLSS